MSFSISKVGILLSASAMLITSFASCSKDEKQPISEVKTQLPFSGKYVWKFTIPNMGEQVSEHTFFADSIQYSMVGNAYTNAYTQVLVSYNAEEKRCITQGKGGGKDSVYFLMFFKDVTASAITIYKKECKNREEAETLAVPNDNTSADHGWNVYYKK